MLKRLLRSKGRQNIKKALRNLDKNKIATLIKTVFCIIKNKFARYFILIAYNVARFKGEHWICTKQGIFWIIQIFGWSMFS